MTDYIALLLAGQEPPRGEEPAPALARREDELWTRAEEPGDGEAAPEGPAGSPKGENAPGAEASLGPDEGTDQTGQLLRQTAGERPENAGGRLAEGGAALQERYLRPAGTAEDASSGPASGGTEWLDQAVRESLRPWSAAAGNAGETGTAAVRLLPAEGTRPGLEELDRLVRRDARRYDGGFALL